MIRRALSFALVCWAALSWSAVATAREDHGALTFVAHEAEVADAHVIDVRDLQSCAQASLPGARCLPIRSLVSPTDGLVGFHALRWLLGTVGLSGAQTVLVIGANARDVRTVGALLYLAGQRRVRLLDKPFAPQSDDPGGVARSLSREVVFTEPMRDKRLLINRQSGGAPYTDLASFAEAVERGDKEARLLLP